MEAVVEQKFAKVVAKNIFEGVEGILSELGDGKIELLVSDALFGNQFTYVGKMSDIEMI